MTKTTRFELPTTNVGHNSDITTYLYLPPDACPFTPTGLIIPDDVAPHFLITSISVGLDSQLLSVGAIPASLFAESAHRHAFAMDPADEKKLFKVSVTNISAQARNFQGSVEGIPASADPGIPKPTLRMVGFGCTLVEGGCGCTSANINVEPQITIVPQWLHVPPHVLEHFEINDIFICSLHSPHRSGSVPKHFLTKQQIERSGAICLVPNPVAPTGMFITISVTNTDSQSRNFETAILGTPPEKEHD